MKFYYRPIAQSLEDSVPSLETYLESLNATILKQLARVWLGKAASTLNKEACLLEVRKTLSNPDAVKNIVNQLSDFERAGLGLIKLRGGKIAYTEEFSLELLMLGYTFNSKSTSNNYEKYDAINSLILKGIVVQTNGSSGPIDKYRYSLGVFADPRVLAHIKPVAPLKLSLKSVDEIQSSFVKRPSEVLLNLVAFGQTIDTIGGVATSAKGLPTKTSLKKIAKILGWNDKEDETLPTFLLEPALFYFSLWVFGGLIKGHAVKQLFLVDESAVSILQQPFEEQAKFWVKAYRSLKFWLECVPERFSIYDVDLTTSNKFNSMRAVLLLALAALPDSNAWYRISDLSTAIYNRIGPYFFIGHRRNFYTPYNSSAEKVEELRQKWKAELFASWNKEEFFWIKRAITGPLYHLGLVELGFESKSEKSTHPDIFRLTQAGRAAIYNIFRPELETKVTTVVTTTGQCWVIQPNFDVIVYLESTQPSQLAFIERIGVRQRIDGATAAYHLTQESIYQALESGIEAKTIIETLKTGSLHPIPDNIVRSLSTWAQRREQISVYCNANILEFGDKKSRDAAITKGQVQGTPIGERLILVANTDELKLKPKTVIAYEPSPPKCLSVDEIGTIKINLATKDLLIEGELAAYSQVDKTHTNKWVITRKTVELANSRGWTAEAIIEALSNRTSHRLAPILVKTIHAWSGKNTNSPPKSLTLPKVTILQVEQQDLADAIAVSKLFQEYFEIRLGTNAFLVKADIVTKLNEKLLELGFNIGKELLLKTNGDK